MDDEGKVSVEKILKQTAHSATQSKVRNNQKTYSDQIIQSHKDSEDTSGSKRKLSEEGYTQLAKMVSLFGSYELQ